MGELTGKNAIVTGAGRRIGRAHALKLASVEASVAGVDKDLTSFTSFAAESAAMTAERVRYVNAAVIPVDNGNNPGTT